MRRTARLLLASALTLAGSVAIALPQLAAPAEASATTVNSVRLNGYEATILADINSARSSHGLRALAVTAGTTDVARRWAWHLAGAQFLSHNPSLASAIGSAGSSAWGMVSENVGSAPYDDPAMLFDAYMNSAPHRANILDPQARYIGVGVVDRGDTAWNTLDFTDAYSTSYGVTRVPAQGLPTDAHTVTTTTSLASFESRPDQRFSSVSSSGVAASLLHFTGPTSGNDRAYATFTRKGTSGHGDVYMRDALNLSHVTSIGMQLGSSDSRRVAVPVQVLLTRAYGDTVSLGTIRVGGGAHWFTVSVPSTGRDLQDTLTLRVSNTSLSTAGGSATLSVYAVNANV
jgi:uncharacterized protein YkwD